MIDLSDGLGGDAVHLSIQSGAGLRIDAASLPVAEGVAEVAAAAGRDPLELAASGGEDYELLAALPPENLGAATRGRGREWRDADAGRRGRRRRGGRAQAAWGGADEDGWVRPARSLTERPAISSSLTPRRLSIASATRDGIWLVMTRLDEAFQFLWLH